MRITNQILSKVGDLTKQFSNFPESYVKRSMEQVRKSLAKRIKKPGTDRLSHLFTLRFTGELHEGNQTISQGL